jgi:hypothetical protein
LFCSALALLYSQFTGSLSFAWRCGTIRMGAYRISNAKMGSVGSASGPSKAPTVGFFWPVLAAVKASPLAMRTRRNLFVGLLQLFRRSLKPDRVVKP